MTVCTAKTLLPISTFNISLNASSKAFRNGQWVNMICLRTFNFVQVTFLNGFERKSGASINVALHTTPQGSIKMSTGKLVAFNQYTTQQLSQNFDLKSSFYVELFNIGYGLDYEVGIRPSLVEMWNVKQPHN